MTLDACCHLEYSDYCLQSSLLHSQGFSQNLLRPSSGVLRWTREASHVDYKKFSVRISVYAPEIDKKHQKKYNNEAEDNI